MGAKRILSSARAAKRLFVGNVPWTVGHIELKNYFAQFGQVGQASVIFDKKTGLSKGYGFVHFTTTEGVKAATEASAHKLEGYNLTVQPATDA